MDLRQLDKKYFGRQGEPEDVVVGHSADSYLTDARGRKYIDFMMGWCVGNLGWGNTEIRAAAKVRRPRLRSSRLPLPPLGPACRDACPHHARKARRLIPHYRRH